MENNELKPCPFCNGQAKIEVNMSAFTAKVYCTSCNASMKNCYRGNEWIEKFMENLISEEWNRRVIFEDSGLPEEE